MTTDPIDDTGGPVRLAVDLRARPIGASVWTVETVAGPGDVIEYQLSIENTGPSVARDVAARVDLAPHLTYVRGSVKLANSNIPEGEELGLERSGTSLFDGGYDVGHYSPGANAYLYFQAQVDAGLEDGTSLHTVGVARAAGNPGSDDEIYNVATICVTTTCSAA